ncbi:MAG: tetratricopeptide repeat protein [Pseudohongiellaceae bacterium]
MLFSALLLVPAMSALAAEGPDLDARQAELQAGYDAYETGLDAAGEGDYATAIREFRRAAGDGLDVAQYNLGILYYTGRGVEPDHEQALHWLKQAARQGHTAAQFNVGVMYFNGQGVTSTWQDIWPLSLLTRSGNRAEAAEWYERAASSGHAEAQYYLATMYQEGLGVDEDPVQAHFWAQAARENEYRAARELLATLERGMNREQISEARRLYAEQTLPR